MSEVKALHEQCKLINATAGLGVVEAEFWTDDSGALLFTTRGPNNTGMWIDWGDGSGEWIQHAGITGIFIETTHTYAIAGVKQLKFSGVLSGVSFFKVTDSSLNGDIGEFVGFSECTGFQLRDTSLSGNISGISGMTNITQLHAYSTDVTGDVNSLSALTGMTDLRIQNTALTGDLGDLSVLASMTSFYAYSMILAYGSTALPAWSNCNLQIYSNGFSQSEVDNFLIDLAAAGGTNGTLNIAGTNATRSSASDAAKATLLGNGWSVTVNE